MATLGAPLPTLIYRDWQFVVDDLHDINKRVRDHDRDCRLVAHHETHNLALARWVTGKMGDAVSGGGPGAWMVALRLRDPRTGEPMKGEPSPEILTIQKQADAERVGNLARWREKERIVMEREEAARAAEASERHEEFARGLMRMQRKDLGINRSIFIPSGKGL